MGLTWLVVESTQIGNSTFLRNFLRSRFPQYSFLYKKFDAFKALVRSAVQRLEPDGIIAELKSLEEKSLERFDELTRRFKSAPIILVLTPSAFQLLSRRRKKSLQRNIIVMSETKSLDYLVQLPRIMEEIRTKRRLRIQNERLQKLAKRHLPNLNSFGLSAQLNEALPSEKLIRETLKSGGARSSCGLKINFNNWNRLKKSFGDTAESELLNCVSRMIHRVVRNSDRVLRSQEDEFLLFLSNTDSSNLSRCKDRLQTAFRGLHIEANQKKIRLSVQISAFDQ